MFRSLIVAAAISFAVPAMACPMADAAAYATAVEAVQVAQGTQVSLKVDGMSCGECSNKVTAALEKIDGVNAAAVDYQTGEVKIAIDEAKTDSAALIKVITETGFAASLNS